MLGAVIGDIVGSVYERDNIKTKEFRLFGYDARCTDDSIMTAAVAEAVMNGGSEDDFIDAMKKYGRMFPYAGYAGGFRNWLRSESREPYGSWGNGSAMRVSPCAWVMDCGFTARTGMFPEKGRELARRSAAVTHNSPEGITGALAIADAIFIARLYSEEWVDDHGDRMVGSIEECKKRIREHTETVHGYELSRTLDEIRPGYEFDVSCQGSVPVAIQAFLESTDFEDALRNAVSVGGDSDTIAAMAGSIAEAAYGIPEEIINKAMVYMEPAVIDVYKRWRLFLLDLKC